VRIILRPGRGKGGAVTVKTCRHAVKSELVSVESRLLNNFKGPVKIVFKKGGKIYFLKSSMICPN
jgi:hypothetical protein